MSNLKFTSKQINEIIGACSVLRACPQVPFELANEVNGLGISLKPASAKHQEKADVLDERAVTINGLEDGSERTKQIAEHNVNSFKLSKEQFTVSIAPIKAALFAGIDLLGEKETQLQNGVTIKQNYRDAYFTLVEHGCIV